MIIRLARQDDLPVINAIYNQAVAQRFCTAHLMPVTMEERKAWFSGHSPGRYPVYVSCTNDRVTGWVSLGPYRKDRQALAHVCEVSYYVDRDARRKGIGRLLLQHAIQIAAGLGFSVMVAILLDKNHASIGLLEKSGFTLWACMPGLAIIDGQKVDHIYMGLML